MFIALYELIVGAPQERHMLANMSLLRSENQLEIVRL
jgi:hypothetical protein